MPPSKKRDPLNKIRCRHWPGISHHWLLLTALPKRCRGYSLLFRLYLGFSMEGTVPRDVMAHFGSR